MVNTVRGRWRRVDYTPSDNEKMQAEIQAESQAKTQGSKAEKTSGRLTLGEEKKGRSLKQTALKIPSCRYLIDYNEN